MKNSIKIIDFNATDNFHEVINMAMSCICSHLYKEVIYKVGKSAKINDERFFIKNNIEQPGNLIFKQFRVYESNSNLGRAIRMILGFFITFYEYLTTKKTETILYVYTNSFSMPFIMFLNMFLCKKVIFLMHGELELLYLGKISFIKPTFWYRSFHKLAFNYCTQKSKCLILVLGDSIKKNFLNFYPNLKDHVIAINHPYFLKENQDYINTSKNEDDPLRIGLIGTFKKEKGSHEILTLADLLEEDINEKKVELYSIGMVHDLNVNAYNLIHWIGTDGKLERKAFDDFIERLDFILYLYPKDSYRLTASGAILDAINLSKPIISLKNDYFQHLIKNESIGFICNSVEEIGQVIKDLLNNKIKNEINSVSFENIRKVIGIPYNTELFKEELIKKNYI